MVMAALAHALLNRATLDQEEAAQLQTHVGLQKYVGMEFQLVLALQLLIEMMAIALMATDAQAPDLWKLDIHDLEQQALQLMHAVLLVVTQCD